MKKNLLATSLLAVLSLTGCGTFPGWLPGSGVSRQQVQEERDTSGRIEGIQVVDVNDALARKLADSKKLGQFSNIFVSKAANNYQIGPGDVIEVTIWEAPPAMLFSSLTPAAPMAANANTANGVTLPAQMVASDGTITIPFAGRVGVKGRTTEQIEANIVSHLKGKANLPQVLVSVTKNNASNVTVVGEVNASAMMPLTPKGERLLDALAFAGGVKQQVNRMAVQLSRGDVTATMPLDSIIRDPRQNVVLRPGDVVTALFQPQSFSVLGATGKNDEIPFEAQGISLAQALARSGGLNDSRADARGVFVFRFEDPKLIDLKDSAATAVNGAVPVVYEIDLRDPAAFFVTQNFPIQNRDVIYVSNSPGAEFKKFLSFIVMVADPAATLNRELQ
ncbi:polysaccharide biosynthesis/export family protein [Burkholderia multivorans]|uniref:polysaccharide biosynthesis/export family protein n=1 Tax=Burkholderia multivorans TaxID=87883 RepID=UPI001BA08492|nr:polysaccharide biosynthesis/export family protein [Burkholderia multivorans]MBR7899604.1 polysaccharide export protein [Burkholderia multivorans]MBU9221329.1 polysaccharide export protein [Burkholderia multivorans]